MDKLRAFFRELSEWMKPENAIFFYPIAFMLFLLVMHLYVIGLVVGNKLFDYPKDEDLPWYKPPQEQVEEVPIRKKIKNIVKEELKKWKD